MINDRTRDIVVSENPSGVGNIFLCVPARTAQTKPCDAHIVVTDIEHPIGSVLRSQLRSEKRAAAISADSYTIGLNKYMGVIRQIDVLIHFNDRPWSSLIDGAYKLIGRPCGIYNIPLGHAHKTARRFSV